jgi:hypothetical protein
MLHCVVVYIPLHISLKKLKCVGKCKLQNITIYILFVTKMQLVETRYNEFSLQHSAVLILHLAAISFPASSLRKYRSDKMRNITCFNCLYRPMHLLIPCTSQFLGVFTKSGKVILSFVMSVSPTACPPAWNNLAPTGRIFMEFDILSFYFLPRLFKFH